MRISFAGCGFMGVYHIGVGHCIYERTPEILEQMEGCYGTSAGAIVAVCMAINARTEDGNRFVVKATKAVHKNILGAFHPGFDPGAHIEEFLEEILPPNAHRDLTGKVRVSVTELPTLKNRIIGDFNTRKELIKVRATCVRGLTDCNGWNGCAFNSKHCEEREGETEKENRTSIKKSFYCESREHLPHLLNLCEAVAHACVSCV